METFRDLYLHLNGVDIEDFVQRASRVCNGNWGRNIEKEDNLGLVDNRSLCFERSEDRHAPAAALFIYPHNNDTWYVSNIVPNTVGQLNYSQYNEILMDFCERVAKPAIEGTDIKLEVTSDEISIGSVAGEDVEQALVRFSGLANMSTGSSHPSDRKRWLEFIALAFDNPSDLHSDLVIRALEELGWPEDQAIKLGIEYEFADSLLSYLRER